MPSAGSIRAGQAFVEVLADNSKLRPGLDAARSQLEGFGHSASILSDRWVKHSIGIYAYSHGIAGGLELLTAGIKAYKGDWEGVEKLIDELPFGIGRVFKATMGLIDEISGEADRKRQEAAAKAVAQAERIFDDMTAAIRKRGALIGVHDENYKQQLAAYEAYLDDRRRIGEKEQEAASKIGAVKAGQLAATARAAARDTYVAALDEIETQQARHVAAESAKTDELMNAASRRPGYKGDAAALRARQQQESDNFQGGDVDRALMGDRHRGEQYAQDLRYAAEAADALKEMQSQISQMTGKTSAFDAEWAKLVEKFGGMPDWDARAGKLKETMKELFRLKAEEGVVKQIDDLGLRIKVATGKMSELEAAKHRIMEANPQISAARALALAKTEQAATLAEWGHSELQNAETKAEKLADLAKKLKTAVSQELLTPDQADKIWNAHNKGKEVTAGIFNAAAILGLQGGTGTQQDRIAAATEKTAANTDKILTKGGNTFQ